MVKQDIYLMTVFFLQNKTESDAQSLEVFFTIKQTLENAGEFIVTLTIQACCGQMNV